MKGFSIKVKNHRNKNINTFWELHVYACEADEYIHVHIYMNKFYIHMFIYTYSKFQNITLKLEKGA